MNLLSEKKNVLKDINVIYNIPYYINGATCYEVNGQRTLLDPVIVSPYCEVQLAKVIDVDRSISDYQATQVHLKIPRRLNSCTKRTVWLYKHGYFNAITVVINSFVCLLGFKVRAAIFQLYPDDEHEVDDKMNMK